MGPSWGEYIGHGWKITQKADNTECLCFRCCCPEAVENNDRVAGDLGHRNAHVISLKWGGDGMGRPGIVIKNKSEDYAYVMVVTRDHFVYAPN